DISQLVAPSWITPPPSDFGSPSQGKLKADAWCTLCTICLPITLIRLWGCQDRQSQESLDTDRKFASMTNFMDLVQAILLATSRTLSQERIDSCLLFMKHYQVVLKDLYPKEHRDKPNLHALLHLPNLLTKFSPVHAWWTFPFERLIGCLQRVKTNQKNWFVSLIGYRSLLNIKDRRN
ncbi:hypothetical protein K439DRAFT_1336009, partial [Ramaria rubella]